MRLLAGVVLPMALCASWACSDDGKYEKDMSPLEASCGAYCEAADGCPGNYVDLCLNACSTADSKVPLNCADQAIALMDCEAAGTFTCTDYGSALPNALCTAENQAFDDCTVGVTCASFCATAEAANCPPAGWAGACREQCVAARGSLGDDCGAIHDVYMQCTMDADDVGCTPAGPTSPTCDDDLALLRSCLGSHMYSCESYCWLGELFGCGDADGCETTCDAATTAPCLYLLGAWLSCVVDAPDASCGSDGLESAGCEDLRQDYLACAGG